MEPTKRGGYLTDQAVPERVFGKSRWASMTSLTRRVRMGRPRGSRSYPGAADIGLSLNHSNRTLGARARQHGPKIIGAMLLLLWGVFRPTDLHVLEQDLVSIWGVDRAVVREGLSDTLATNEFPREVRPGGGGAPSIVSYTLDAGLQESVAKVLDHYRPDYGVFVAVDPESGRVLSMLSRQREGANQENLALPATYPAASVFKIITAAAALDLGKANADTVVPFNGKTTSLYKKNVLNHRNNKWTRHLPLRTSFAKSVNVVFGRLGLQYIGPESLNGYAERFGFNQALDSDLALDVSRADIRMDDDWSTVETASGYTRNTTLNPVHAALIAATIVNDGRMPQASIVDSVSSAHGILRYVASGAETSPVISATTATQMRTLMRETVKRGSASKSFRKFFRGDMKDVEVGGKTGSLTGMDPKGKYDWFVGYAARGDRKLAFAALCINKEFWYVKSAYVARKAIEHYFQKTGESD